MYRFFYNLLLHLALPFVPLRLWWRGRKEPAYRQHIAQRFGFAYPASPNKPLIWLHAVSLGETRAAQPLLRALRARYPDHTLLITHMTATGREAATTMYGDFAQTAFLPYDLPWAMARFLDHFRPRLALLMETEVWPNLLYACAARNIPTVLVNTRLSARSARGYARLGRFTNVAFASLHAVAAQSEADAARLRELGATNVIVTGNLKFDIAVSSEQSEAEATLRDAFASRKVFLLASTREGEEELVLDALARHPFSADVLTIIVPRHPQRFDEVAAMLTRCGLVHVRRSEHRSVPQDCRFFLGDSMGEMTAYYAASDLAFIGGSLLPYGAQNLIEACAAGTPVLIGPSTFNFAQAAELAMQAGAARSVADADALLETAQQLLQDKAALQRMGEAGRSFTRAHRGATARSMALLEPLLQRPTSN